MEIRERLDNNKGYHAQVVDRQHGQIDCARCHAEHAGRNLNLVRWPGGVEKFDHAQTGYRLEGKHATAACAQCHKPDRIPAARRSAIVVKDLARTYLGLDRDCLSCHSDPHRSELGSQCASCHSEDAWRPVTGFNHNATRYPLTGAHIKVSCRGCHPVGPGATVPVSFKRDDFANCASCHKDPHSGGFKAACSTCHVTAGWRVAKAALTANFDHSKTRYPLAGKHAGLACALCHQTTDFGAPLKFGKCMDCHEDKHKKQFLARTDRGECKACHMVDGFKPTTFKVADHAATKYPLAGKHVPVLCVKCHEGQAENANYHPRFGSCTDCHKDVHAGQFEKRYANKCESCHDVNGFTPSSYTLARHREARFALAGAHLATACVDCHKAASQQEPHRYLFADLSCTSCHADPHELQRSGATTCETCHTIQSWKAILSFEHDSTRLPLRGAHRVIACLACHKPPEQTAPALMRIVFRSAPSHCSGCHEDAHAGQFQTRPGGSDCASCHNAGSWRPSTFDHSRTELPLDGGHRGVTCIACHKTVTRTGERSVVVYSKAPKECAACH